MYKDNRKVDSMTELGLRELIKLMVKLVVGNEEKTQQFRKIHRDRVLSRREAMSHLLRNSILLDKYRTYTIPVRKTIMKLLAESLCSEFKLGYPTNLKTSKAEIEMITDGSSCYSAEDFSTGIGIGMERLAGFWVHKKETKEQFINREENTMASLEITRPVLVGNINILTATKEQLVLIIREANTRLYNDQDLASLSTKFRDEAKDLRLVITLCVEQLDKD